MRITFEKGRRRRGRTRRRRRRRRGRRIVFINSKFEFLHLVELNGQREGANSSDK